MIINNKCEVSGLMQTLHWFMFRFAELWPFLKTFFKSIIFQAWCTEILHGPTADLNTSPSIFLTQNRLSLLWRRNLDASLNITFDAPAKSKSFFLLFFCVEFCKLVFMQRIIPASLKRLCTTFSNVISALIWGACSFWQNCCPHL